MKFGFILIALGATGCVTETEQVEETSAELNSGTDIPNNRPFRNTLGHSATWSTAGSVDMTTAFTTDLGTNQRHCGSCHKPDQGWTVTADSVSALFEATGGLDPIFRTNDGSNSPNADVSTVEARRAAYSMLLTRGTIRVGIGIPADAEFELIAVDDPYGFATAAELSLFRRPLPSANLTLIPTVMWDGRVPGVPVPTALADQSNGATQGHAAAPDPISQELRMEIVDFEAGLFNAQLLGHDGGRLDADGGKGGPAALASQAFVNARFNLFDAYANSDNPTRRAMFRGQEVFNTRTRINPVTGNPQACRACHNAENVGTNRNGVFFDVNASDASRREADQPLYTLRNKTTGATIQTTDPGRALITGRWIDMNKFKVPSMRGLSGRAPYYHGGSAGSLEEVVAHYESIGFNFTPQEEADLVTFMSAL